MSRVGARNLTLKSSVSIMETPDLAVFIIRFLDSAASRTSSKVLVSAVIFGIYMLPISNVFITSSRPPMWSSWGWVPTT